MLITTIQLRGARREPSAIINAALTALNPGDKINDPHNALSKKKPSYIHWHNQSKKHATKNTIYENCRFCKINNQIDRLNMRSCCIAITLYLYIYSQRSECQIQ